MLDVMLATAVEMGGIVIDRLPLALAFAVVFTVLCALFPCNPGPLLWRRKELVLDLLWWFLFPLMGRYLGLVLAFIGVAVLAILGGGAMGLGPADGPLAGLPLWAQAIAYVLISELYLYWSHRIFHGPALWRYHAIHHSPEDLDWISANRFHPVDQFLHSMPADIMLILLGVSPEVLLPLATFNTWHGALIHANLNWDFGPLKYVLVSPVYHRWHHTDVARGGEKNFAATLPIIDLIFGTFYMPKGVLPDGYGVDDPHFPRDLGSQLLYPWRKRAPDEPASAPGPAAPPATP